MSNSTFIGKWLASLTKPGSAETKIDSKISYEKKLTTSDSEKGLTASELKYQSEDSVGGHRNTNLDSHCPGMGIAQNTILHDAILASDAKAALDYVQRDKKAEIINIPSLKNTPLLLSLKTGMIDVALALLKHPKIDIFLQDVRGLSAFEWACMLRQDSLIEIFLEKGADPHRITTQWASSFLGEPVITPIKLYQRDVCFRNFSDYACGDLLASVDSETYQKSGYYSIFRYLDKNTCQFKYFSGFIDRHDLHIPGEMAYTDVIFFMQKLCTNLNWKSKKYEFQETKRSCDTFSINFRLGMNDFCNQRNALTVNPQLVEKMEKIQSKDLRSTCTRNNST